MSLWARLDAAFAAAFAAAMGEDGSYATLRLQEVAVNETWNPDRGDFPRMILYSTSARVGASEHGGGGTRRLDVAYPYLAVAVCTGTTYSDARTGAQELFGRMLAVLAQSSPILAAAMTADPASGERAVRVVFERGAGASGIEVRGRQGANGGRYLGIALTAWVVETKTGA